MTAPPVVVVVGAGFAGLSCARRLERKLAPGRAEVVVVNPANYMLYTPLLPEAASGMVEPRHVVVPLRQVLRRSRVVVGSVVGVDVVQRVLRVRSPQRADQVVAWDRLVLAPGSVTRALPIPGLVEHARGFKTLAEAIFLRNHVLAQLELADGTDDPQERRTRCTFVVVGAGYAGTELVAELQALSKRACRAYYPRLRRDELRWLLIDVADKVLPELGGELADQALAVLRRRGVDVRLATTVEEVGEDWVLLSDGDRIPTRTFVWSAGVAPDPLVARIGLPVDERGRLLVDDHLRVTGRTDVFGLGDSAAVPDPAKPGRPSPPTAQHALRQGRVCADNVAASLGVGTGRPFTFRGLGLLVNLGEREGVGRVVGLPVSGLLGWLITRSYHWAAMPTWGRRVRIALDWAVGLFTPADIAELGSLGMAGRLVADRPGDDDVSAASQGAA